MVKDRKVRVAITKESHWLFFHFYFAHYVTYPTAKFQAEIFEMTEKEIEQVANLHTSSSNCEDWNLQEIEQTMATIFPPISDENGSKGINLKDIVCPQGSRDKGKDAEMRTKLIDYLFSRAKDIYAKMAQSLGNIEQIKQLERAVLLNSIDTLWMDHLESLDNLRTAVGLRGYGQRDPLVEYKRDAYGLFQQLQGSIRNQVVYSVFKVIAARSTAVQGAGNLLPALGRGLSALQGMRFSAPAKTSQEQTESPFSSGSSDSPGRASSSATQMMQNASLGARAISPEPRNRFDGEKVGRNDLCPCGSGKKFKKCHGR